MGKGLPRSNSRGAAARQELIKQSVKISGTLNITGATATIGNGTFAIAGLPQGNMLFLGATAYVIVDGGSDAHIINNWDGDFAIGTVPNANTNLSGSGEADIIPSTPLDAGASDKITPSTRGASTATENGLIIDNTDGSLELNFNLLLDAGVITNAQVGTFTVTGVLTLAYIMLGDD